MDVLDKSNSDFRNVKRKKQQAEVLQPKKKTSPRRLHLYLKADDVDFIDDFIFSLKKDHNRRTSMNVLIRAALHGFQSLDTPLQLELIDDETEDAD